MSGRIELAQQDQKGPKNGGKRAVFEMGGPGPVSILLVNVSVTVYGTVLACVSIYRIEWPEIREGGLAG